MKNKFFKYNKKDKVYWARNFETDGDILFSFDKIKTYNLFRDYPYKLTKEEKEIFDAENPFWADYFSDRVYEG